MSDPDGEAAVRRFLFREFVAEQTAKHEWWQAVEHAIEHEGWKIVLLLRLTPLVPFNLLNYALACTAVRFWDYTWASSVGVLPGMVRSQSGLALRLPSPPALHLNGFGPDFATYRANRAEKAPVSAKPALS